MMFLPELISILVTALGADLDFYRQGIEGIILLKGIPSICPITMGELRMPTTRNTK
jgi:hypothetical protein